MAGAVRRQGSGAGPGRRGDSVGTLGLLALLLGGAALGYVLRELAGGPRAPDGAHIREVLSGTELADSDLASASAALAWLVLAYLALSVGLRLAALLAGRLSGGARWARTGLRLSNLVTIPAVRRLVDGGVGGTLLAASWLPLPSQVEGAGHAYAAAAAAPPPPLVAWVDAPPPAAEAAPEAPPPPCVLYTVAPGDDLWEIARRCYGDGSRFVEIFEASRGLQVAGGERFSDPRVVRPGWVLRVPMPALERGRRGPHHDLPRPTRRPPLGDRGALPRRRLPLGRDLGAQQRARGGGGLPAHRPEPDPPGMAAGAAGPGRRGGAAGGGPGPGSTPRAPPGGERGAAGIR